jgi:hypothetical protein
MGKLLFAAAVVIVVATLPGSEAKAGAFCIYGHEGKRQCAYNTWEQCRASASGLGGFCERNPQDPALWARAGRR